MHENLMLILQRFVRILFRTWGLDLVRYSHSDRGLNPYLDMSCYIKNTSPIIFDVGANLGESIESLLLTYPSAHIFAFEPSIESFTLLEKKYGKLNNIYLYCEALWSHNCNKLFNDNEYPYMSSFFELGVFGYGNILRKRQLELRSIDTFASTENLSHIDILKIDAQGSELDILKGCLDLFGSDRIKLILIELTFTNMYDGPPGFDTLLKLLYDNNFFLAGIYRQHFQKGFLSWADGLFVHKTLLI